MSWMEIRSPSSSGMKKHIYNYSPKHVVVKTVVTGQCNETSPTVGQ